jgi:multiple sugar transport system permease protein
MAAYSFSRYAFPLRNIFFLLTLCTKMIPQVVIGIPIYMLLKEVRLMDSVVSLILVYTAFNLPFVIWLMRSFFDGVPFEIDEAAKMDGCSRFGIFAKVVIPISAPGLATSAIFCFMFSWNEFLFALLLTASKAKTMPVGISEFITIWSIEWGPMAATAVSFTIPVLLFSLFVQKYIVTGMTLGAVKG